MHLNIARIFRRSINVFYLSEKWNYTDMNDTITKPKYSWNYAPEDNCF